MKTFLTTCVQSTAELIDAMTENATEIDYAELLEHVTQDELDETFPIYAEVPNLTLQSDWSVNYWKGDYNGNPCVYVDHSRQEHIFVELN